MPAAERKRTRDAQEGSIGFVGGEVRVRRHRAAESPTSSAHPPTMPSGDSRPAGRATGFDADTREVLGSAPRLLGTIPR